MPRCRRPFARSLLLRTAPLVAALLAAGAAPGLDTRAAHAQDVEILGERESPAERHYRQGEKLLRLGKLEAAVAEFDRATKAAPTFHMAYYAAGNVLVRLGRLREAEEHYRDSVAADPTFAHGWNAIGVVLLKKRDNTKALRAFEKAIAKDPEFELARLHRAKALTVLERHAEAEKELRALVAAKSTNLGARVALAASRLAQDDTNEALLLVDQVLAQAKKHGDALVLRVQVLARKGDLMEAADALATALEFAGTEPEIRARVGALAAHVADSANERGKPAANLRALEVLVNVKPKDPRTRTNYGAALIMMWGRTPESKRDPALLERGLLQLEKSLQLEPDQPGVRKILARYRGT